jgi:hypothetical protein
MSPQRLRFILIVLISASCLPLAANAQGFPGGGGHGGGGRGGMGGPGGHHQGGAPRAAGEQPHSDPLSTFTDGLRGLRETLLIREEQAPAWMAMRDALQAYVEVQQTKRLLAADSTPVDSLQRLKKFADDERSRADALKLISQTMEALVMTLDSQQTQVFLGRLDAAFAPKASS